MRVKIRTPSRIHMTLIDLNGSIGRIDGGIGFALQEPFVEIVAEESEDVKVENANNDKFVEVAKRLFEKFEKGIKLKVISDYKAHIGLGSGTQISLAVAKAYSEIYGLGLSVRKLAEITGRGGTSGIGVAVFELGGFVVDGGHSKKEKSEFLPSSASKAKPPVVLARYDFPSWDIVLAIPDLSGFYGRREVNLFKEFCPIALDDVRELCHITLMKLMPAVLEEDLDEFGNAVYRIQRIGFKRIEINQYGDLIWDLLDCASDVTKAVGMSSTGPTVYGVVDTNKRDLEMLFKEYFKERGINCEVITTKAKNCGAEVFYNP
jgi:beta-ribofuranosylaminobenzene 5'-phosphate synthase